jgi:hypothetical protein
LDNDSPYSLWIQGRNSGNAARDISLQPLGGKIGIGTEAPTASLDVAQGGAGSLMTIIGGADLGAATRTDDTRKFFRMGMPHYHNAEEPFNILCGDSSGTQNKVIIGGGTSLGNAATDILFNTAANDATTTGTTRMIIDESGNVGIGVIAPTDTLAVSGGIKIGEFNSTDGTGYAGTSPPSDHNNGTGASDPQIRVSGRTSDAPGIIQMAFFDANNFFGGTGEFVLGKLQYAMNENSNTVTTVAEIRGITSDPQTAGNFDGALKFLTSQGDASSANLTEKMILTSDGYLGIGTDAPVSTLDIGTGGIFTLGNTRTALKLTGSQADLQLSHTTNAHILIDSTADTSDSYFSVRKDSLTASAATELFRVNENGIIKFNNAYDFPNAAGSTGDVLQLNGTSLEFASQTRMTKPAVFMDTGTQNVTQVETTVGFNSEILDAANNASISGTNDGHILLGAAGYYRISYSIPINDDGSTGADRTRIFCFMQTDDNDAFTSPTKVAQSSSQVYTREASGGSGLSTSFIYQHASENYIRLRIDAENNTDISTEANESQISIEYLGA